MERVASASPPLAGARVARCLLDGGPGALALISSQSCCVRFPPLLSSAACKNLSLLVVLCATSSSFTSY